MSKLTIILVACLLFSCGTSLSSDDKELIDSFKENSFQLNELAQKLNANPAIIRIAETFSWVQEGSQNLEKTEQKELYSTLKKSHVPEGMFRNEDYSGIFFIKAITGITDAGTVSGFFYSTKEVSTDRLTDEISSFNNSGEQGFFFKKIQPNWYLFIEFSG